MRTLEPKTSIDNRYVEARKRVEELKGFYYSLVSYCLVIPFLIFIWYQYSSHTIQWFWFPMIGWGLSLVFQGYKVFVSNGLFGADWEKRQIEKFMREEEQQHWN